MTENESNHSGAIGSPDSAGTIYRIHPAIGISRLGDSPDRFYITPETPGSLPIDCNENGDPILSPDGKSEVPVTQFKDAAGRIKRAAARFQIYVYDDNSPDGRPLNIGDPIRGGGNHGTLIDIQWRVYLANKKAAWYTFEGAQGEHGYAPDHPLRNAGITDPNARQRLIIDPGPRTVNATNARTASFHRTGPESGQYAQTFPPDLSPHSIETLGDLKTDSQGRLLVLGGHGHSGSFETGFAQPRIDDYANNDGWFDDTSDGPVMARLVMFSEQVGRLRFVDVEYPAWVIAGYPRYAPEILDMITLEDVIEDLSIRQFAARTDLFGETGTFDAPAQIDPTDLPALVHWRASRVEWNPDYRPWFYRDVWPILFRADEFSYLNNILQQSNFPHNQSPRGNFDAIKLSQPPVIGAGALVRRKRQTVWSYHTGKLMIERLEPALTLLQMDNVGAIAPSISAMKLSASLSDVPSSSEDYGKSDVRSDIERALRSYAAATGALESSSTGETSALDEDNTANIDPVRYQRAWVAFYEGRSEKYSDAKDELERKIKSILFELDDAPEQSADDLVDPTALLTARRPETEENAKDDEGSESVSATLGRAIQDYCSGRLLQFYFDQDRKACTIDPYGKNRKYLNDLLRQPGEENLFQLAGKPNSRTTGLPLMPLLAGDNPTSNTLPSKFLRLTDYHLYILRQWANGLFYNEIQEGWIKPDAVDPVHPYKGWANRTGRDRDRGVLMNGLGGAFYPGGEVTWVIRNPSIYLRPYRIKADPNFSSFRLTAAQANATSHETAIPEADYSSYTDTNLSLSGDFGTGLQPGDLTKYMPVPWQADFNECTTQNIDVTYEHWNRVYPKSQNDTWIKLEDKTWTALWWPAHRPLQAYEIVDIVDGKPTYQFLDWARGVPGTNAGDLKMVTEWANLGFIIRNPYQPDPATLNDGPPPQKYISVERNEEKS